MEKSWNCSHWTPLRQEGLLGGSDSYLEEQIIGYLWCLGSSRDQIAKNYQNNCMHHHLSVS